MENTWKYKIDLRDEQMFGKIEEQLQLSFPEKLKAFIRAHNAATPSIAKVANGKKLMP